MELAELVRRTRSLEDLPALLARLGHEPSGIRSRDSPTRPWSSAGRAIFPGTPSPPRDADRRARAFARRMAVRGRLCGVMGLDPAGRRLTFAVSLERRAAALGRSRCPGAPPPSPRWGGWRPRGLAGAAGYAAHVAEVLAGEAAGPALLPGLPLDPGAHGRRAPRPAPAADRHALALLQLTRVLFLYFVQAKGWLAGNPRFLAEAVDGCLSRRRKVQRDLLRPLFFGTLNRPGGDRGRTARRSAPSPSSTAACSSRTRWSAESGGTSRTTSGATRSTACSSGFTSPWWKAIAAGSLPTCWAECSRASWRRDERRASGTYYTPAALVDRLVGEGMAALVADRLHCSMSEAERRLADGEAAARQVALRLRVLDPAVGSGAFLLGALERMSSVKSPGASPARIRRRILQANLFGVDRNGAAVRLTELRLWLAVIADDRTERPEDVHPLPNLDCLVRQGDSLFETVGDGLRSSDRRRATKLRELRAAVVASSGRGSRSRSAR